MRLRSLAVLTAMLGLLAADHGLLAQASQETAVVDAQQTAQPFPHFREPQGLAVFEVSK
jgi:hypothetical protein